MQLRCPTWKTLGPLLTNSAWCRQCGKPFTGPLQEPLQQEMINKGMKERTRKSVLVLHHFSVSLSLLILLLIPTATLSLRFHWCLLRHPSASLSWFFFFAMFSWDLFTNCTIERSKALLPWAIMSNQLNMNLLPLCCSDAICVCSPHATPVLWLPTLWVPPLSHPLLLLHWNLGLGACGLLLKMEIVLQVHFGFVCLLQRNDWSPELVNPKRMWCQRWKNCYWSISIILFWQTNDYVQ